MNMTKGWLIGIVGITIGIIIGLSTYAFISPHAVNSNIQDVPINTSIRIFHGNYNDVQQKLNEWLTEVGSIKIHYLQSYGIGSGAAEKIVIVVIYSK